MKPLASEISDCPPESTYLDIAQFYVNEFGRRRLMERLRDKLQASRSRHTAVHKALVAVPVRRIYTTNFDGLLEAALADRELPFNKVINDENVTLISASSTQLIKLHGDIESARPVWQSRLDTRVP